MSGYQNIWYLDIRYPGTEYLKSADRISGHQISESWISDVRVANIWYLDIRCPGTFVPKPHQDTWLPNIRNLDSRCPVTRYLISGDQISGYRISETWRSDIRVPKVRNLDIRYVGNRISETWISDMRAPNIRSLDIIPTPGHFRKQPNQPRHTGTKYLVPGYQMSGYRISEICRSDIRAPNIRNLDI